MIVLQLALTGVGVGCVYALVAFGFVLIYKTTSVVNFAQGEFLMLGGFLAFTVTGILHAPFWVAALLVPCLMALFGAGLFLLVLRPLTGQPALATVLVTIGAAYVLRAVVTMVPGWGTDTHVFPSPYSAGVALGPLSISGNYLATMAVTAMVCTLLYLFFKRTLLGISMQATADNQLAAYYVGVPVSRIYVLVWALSAAVAGLAAVLIAPVSFVHSNMGVLGLRAFPAAVIGGLRNIPGAIAGGLVVGLVESFAGYYLPEGVKDIAPYIVVLAVLLCLPSGIFARRAMRKV